MLEMFQSSMYQTESGMMTVLQSHLALNFHQGQVDHERIALIEILLQKRYEGQTFCIRAMFTAFMGDASNVMSFYGDVDVNGGVGYAVEWWIFKPQKSGKQVNK
jgi:hypothetical protein